MGSYLRHDCACWAAETTARNEIRKKRGEQGRIGQPRNTMKYGSVFLKEEDGKDCLVITVVLQGKRILKNENGKPGKESLQKVGLVKSDKVYPLGEGL